MQIKAPNNDLDMKGNYWRGGKSQRECIDILGPGINDKTNRTRERRACPIFDAIHQDACNPSNLLCNTDCKQFIEMDFIIRTDAATPHQSLNISKYVLSLY